MNRIQNKRKETEIETSEFVATDTSYFPRMCFFYIRGPFRAEKSHLIGLISEKN